MPSHLLRAIILYFMTISIVVIQMTASQSATTDFRYLNCSRVFQCGSISDIGYPFWGSNRPDYCGYPGFELNCTTDQASFMKIKDLTYRVLEIDRSLGIQILKLARTDYTEDVCVPFLHNTTLDLNLFNYTLDTQTITVYYGCPIMPENLAAIPGLSSPFDCNINMSTVEGYYVTRGLSSFGLLADPIRENLQKCNISVIIPAYQPAIQSLERNATQANLIPALAQGFKLHWSINDSLCFNCRMSGGRCGYNQTRESFTCYCPDQPSITICSKGYGTTLRIGVIVVVIVATVFGICLGCCLLIVIQRRKRIAARAKMEAFIRNDHSLVPKRYSYSDVKRMTNSFTDKLGKGGFGGVYKGTLPDGLPVAVKVLKKSNGDGEEFINEVASTSRTSHVNIVNLLGFCYERTKRALIYEYMCNGSLDKFIFNRGSAPTEQVLEWRILYEISIGIARGLEYLHRGCNTRIVHFDIKPHNILLDEDFCPKISDFGLAKLCKTKESKVSMLAARGTAGYIAPEVFFRNYGGVSYKSDVYSYGMMVLEMVGGRNKMDAGPDASEMFFPDWIYKQLELGELSLVHGAITEEEEEVVKKMILVGLWCIQTNPSDRPSMTKAVEMLEGSLESLQIPPKPFLSSPTRSPQMYSSAMWSQSSAEEQGSAFLVHDQE